jgi:hypothetical protein
MRQRGAISNRRTAHETPTSPHASAWGYYEAPTSPMRQRGAISNRRTAHETPTSPHASAWGYHEASTSPTLTHGAKRAVTQSPENVSALPSILSCFKSLATPCTLRYPPGGISFHPGQDALQTLVKLSSRRPLKPCGVTPQGDGAVGRPRNRFRNVGRCSRK